jgi:hypothetical protein
MPNSAVTYGDLNLYTNPTNNWMTEAPGQLRNPITEARKNVLTSHRSFNCARKAFLEINNAHPFRAHRDSCHLRKHSLRLLHPSLALLLTKVSSRSGSVFWHYPSTVSTLALLEPVAPCGAKCLCQSSTQLLNSGAIPSPSAHSMVCQVRSPRHSNGTRWALPAVSHRAKRKPGALGWPSAAILAQSGH